jgi:hypothetical protein
MPIAKSTNGIAKSAATPQVPTTRSAGVSQDLGQVLAQIPDLDQKPTPLAGIKRVDGRVISHSISLKLVFGMGIGLVVGAILPFLFGRGNSAKKVREIPSWTTAKSNEQTNSSADLSQAPPWQPPKAPATSAVPDIPPPAISVQPPQVGEYRPAALNRQGWTPPRNSAAPPVAPPAGGNVTPDYARNYAAPPPRSDDRGYAPPADRFEQQADRRNDPAARYGNPPGYDYRGYPTEVPAQRRDIQPPPPAGDDRYNNVPNYNGAPNYGGQRQPLGPMTPPPGSAGGYDYRNQPQPQPDGESGVARFEGTITAPPVRTNP